MHHEAIAQSLSQLEKWLIKAKFCFPVSRLCKFCFLIVVSDLYYAEVFCEAYLVYCSVSIAQLIVSRYYLGLQDMIQVNGIW